jgi:hypothetical protein
MFTTLLLQLALSTSAFAQTPADYQLMEITNGDFVHVTLAQIAAKVGTQKQYLGGYVCDGVRENALFGGYAFSNPAGDSLKLKAPSTGSGETFTYKAGVFYRANGSTVRHMSDDFLMKVETALVQLEALPSGKALLSELEHSPYPLTIAKGMNHYNPTGPNGTGSGGIFQASTVMYFKTLFYPESYNMLSQIGNGGNIFFDPDGDYSRIESDDRVRSVAPFIALAHESYHAYDGVRGLLDRRAVVGAAYENEEACEYRAVYFENQIRKEAGVKYAKYYGTTDLNEARGKPSMLSAAGVPYAIPAACVAQADVDAVLQATR